MILRGFEPQPEKSPCLAHGRSTPDESEQVHGLKGACSDDALWLIPAIMEYIRETGETAFLDQVIGYADGGEERSEHMKRILDFPQNRVGAHGVSRGFRADWNDCLNLGGGESALVSFLHVWALEHFLEAAKVKISRKIWRNMKLCASG